MQTELNRRSCFWWGPCCLNKISFWLRIHFKHLLSYVTPVLGLIDCMSYPTFFFSFLFLKTCLGKNLKVDPQLTAGLLSTSCKVLILHLRKTVFQIVLEHNLFSVIRSSTIIIQGVQVNNSVLCGSQGLGTFIWLPKELSHLHLVCSAPWSNLNGLLENLPITIIDSQPLNLEWRRVKEEEKPNSAWKAN